MAAPLVIAHRGASAAHPEHTAAAYEQAIADGADGLECDVRLTRDRVLVCLHDRTVERTSDGTGVVSQLTLDQLQRLDFGSWKAGEAAGVLTLETLLGMVVDAGRPLTLAIETKHPTRYGGEVERRLAVTLQRFGLADGTAHSGVRVRVMSFSPAALLISRRCMSGVPTVALMSRLPKRAGRAPLFGGSRIGGPSLAAVLADPGYVERAHSRGDEVYVWTVDRPEDISRLADLGVDAIITNRPDVARTQLG